MARGRFVYVRGGATPLWVVAVLLAFVAGLLWSRSEGSLALAQAPPLAGARGVYAFAGQIDRNTYGLFMLDIEQGTLWCYEMVNEDGVRKLRLVAGRTWLYDRYLRDFNCAAPDYRVIRDLVALQRTPSEAPSGEEKPKDDAKLGEDKPGGD